MSLKLAIAGKGGVGKTSLSAALARSLGRAGERVVAVDADPNNCLGRALGFPETLLAELKPLSEMKGLLAQRAGVAGGGPMYALDPPVEDLIADHQVYHEGIALLVMGTVDEPGAGCVCPESAVLKAVLRHLARQPDLSLVADMDAGLEHLGRGTARHLDALFVVAEPTPASGRTAARIATLARGLGLRTPGVVLNKADAREAAARIEPYLGELPVIAVLPYDRAVAGAEAVPATGPFSAAVDSLRARLAELLPQEAG